MSAPRPEGDEPPVGAGPAGERPATDTSARRRSAAAWRVITWAAGLFLLGAGLFAFLAPAAFFDAAASFEPYNAHLIRDIGAFQIGLGAVLLLALSIDDAPIVALGGVGLGSLVHTMGHVLDRDLGGVPARDIPFFIALTALLLGAAALRRRETSR